MDRFFNFLRQTLVLTVFLIFGFVMTYIPHPTTQYENVPEAEAFFGGVVIDPTNIAQNTITAANSVGLYMKEFVLDNIAWTLAKSLISSMVASTVDWINSGFQGSPAFVQDLDRYLLDVADSVAGAYFQELSGDLSFLCSPFRLDISMALQLNYVTARERRPYEGCRLTDVFDNFEDFIAGNFSSGSWGDWFEITTNPGKYTPYGAYLTAESSFQARLIAARDAESKTIEFGNGFLSNKVCETIESPSGPVEDCRVVMPGQTISDSLSKALGAGQDTLVTADELSEIIGALISQLSVQALQGTAGLLGLSAGTGYTDGGYSGGSYLGSLQQESIGGDSNSGNSQALNTMEDTLDVQQEYRSLAENYARQFMSILSRRLPDEPSDEQLQTRAAAESGYNQTQTVIEKTTDDIPRIQNIISQYEQLESEYNSSQTSQSRRTTIRQEQTNLINEFTRSGFYTEASYDASRNTWNELVGTS